MSGAERGGRWRMPTGRQEEPDLELALPVSRICQEIFQQRFTTISIRQETRCPCQATTRCRRPRANSIDMSAHFLLLSRLWEDKKQSAGAADREAKLERTVSREAYLIFRAGLARHARKAGLVKVRSSKFEVFGTSNPELRTSDCACRARLACLARSSRTTNEEGLSQQLAGDCSRSVHE